jgi:hypothetical protein
MNFYWFCPKQKIDQKTKSQISADLANEFLKGMMLKNKNSKKISYYFLVRTLAKNLAHSFGLCA